jgi:hypothetical protein
MDKQGGNLGGNCNRDNSLNQYLDAQGQEDNMTDAQLRAYMNELCRFIPGTMHRHLFADGGARISGEITDKERTMRILAVLEEAQRIIEEPDDIIDRPGEQQTEREGHEHQQDEQIQPGDVSEDNEAADEDRSGGLPPQKQINE